MTFNPNNPDKVERLNDAMQASRKHLEPFRSTRQSMIQQFVGDNYGTAGANRRVVANIFQQMAVVQMQRLSGGQPRFNISTHERGLWPFAHRYKQALNVLVQEIHLKQAIQQCVMDAFFTVGLAKVYLKDSPRIEIESNVWMDPGTPFVSPISFKDVVFDTYAGHWDRKMYCGDAYRVDIDLVKDSDQFDPKVRRAMEPSSKYDIGDAEDSSPPIVSGDSDRTEINDMVDLIDLHFPAENLVVTWQLDRATQWSTQGKPLAIRDWDGPERGPYHRLGFVDVPDSSMPAAPGQSMLHLHNAINSLLRKELNNAKNRKELLTFSGSGQDAGRISRYGDGSVIRVDDPKDIQVMKFGGVDPVSVQERINLMDLADRMGGNISTRAGLGAQADTLGQEQIIGQAVSESEAYMIEAVQEFTRGIGEDIGLMLWNDPLRAISGEFRISGTEISVDMGWTPEMREGDFVQYNFTLQPYSLQFRSPHQAVNSVLQLVQQLFIPMLPTLEQQGGRIDLTEFTKQLGDMLDLPWLEEVVKFDQPPATERPGAKERPLQSPTTTRTTVRRNIPTGGTQQSRSLTAQMAFAGMAAPNQDQQMAAGRPAA